MQVKSWRWDERKFTCPQERRELENCVCKGIFKVTTNKLVHLKLLQIDFYVQESETQHARGDSYRPVHRVSFVFYLFRTIRGRRFRMDNVHQRRSYVLFLYPQITTENTTQVKHNVKICSRTARTTRTSTNHRVHNGWYTQ